MARPKKYQTEEERKAALKEYHAKRYQEKKEKIAKQRAEYRQNNKEKIAEYHAEWRKNNPDKQKKYSAKRRETPIGRARMLLGAYKKEDKNANRGECTLTADWIVENIFSQPCAHCGKTGWKIIGCNRLDNSLPHIPNNVEPCCWECNSSLDKKERSKPVYQHTKDGELVKVWESACEAGRNGFTQCHIADCCNKKLKTHKGFIWSYEPLIINKVNNISNVKIS